MSLEKDKECLISHAWRERGGEPQVRLEDLENKFYVSFDNKGDEWLASILLSPTVVSDSYRATVKQYLSGENDSLSVQTLRKLREIGALTDAHWGRIESSVICLKSGKRGKEISLNGLPLDFRSSEWGFLFGMLPDFNIDKNCCFLQSEPLIRSLRNCLKDLGVGSEVVDTERGYRVRGAAVLRELIFHSGFAVDAKQVDENICIPGWVMSLQNKGFVPCLLAGIIESEGSAPDSSRSVRISQSVSIKIAPESDATAIYHTPTGYEVRIFPKSSINPSKVEEVRKKPPLLLASLQKLLETREIRSKLVFESITKTKTNTAARWNLCITGEDIGKVFELCSEFLVTKKEGFEKYFENKKQNHVDKGKRIESYLDAVKALYRLEGRVTSKMLANYMDRAESTATNTLSVLEEEGYVKCVGFEDQYKCWRPVES